MMDGTVKRTYKDGSEVDFGWVLKAEFEGSGGSGEKQRLKLKYYRVWSVSLEGVVAPRYFFLLFSSSPFHILSFLLLCLRFLSNCILTRRAQSRARVPHGWSSRENSSDKSFTG